MPSSARSKSEGGPQYHIQVLSQLGRAFTRLVFQGYHERALTLRDVANHFNMQVKSVPAMEKAAFGLKGLGGACRRPTASAATTSALIAAWYERYKPNRFPKLWEQIDQLVTAGRLVSSIMVLDECSKKSPELHAWLKEREAMFLPPDQVIQQRVDHIVNTYTGLVSQGKQKFAADPFLIATAQVYGFTVVTEETGPTSYGKIPGVCNALNVPNMNLMQLFDVEDWTLG